MPVPRWDLHEFTPILKKHATLLPVEKDRVPVQVADVVCWHDQRAKQRTLDEDGVRRYLAIADREGFRADFDDANVTELWESVEDGPPK